jgi:hypothetical protein
MGVTSLPSYGYVIDPLKPGQLKLQTLTGMIHGVEALVAKNFDGYHKASRRHRRGVAEGPAAAGRASRT